MRKFIEFAKKLHTKNYPNLLKKILDEQIPIAVFSSLSSKDIINNRNILIDILFSEGFNLQYYFTPADVNSEQFSQYPSLKIVNVATINNLKSLPKYVFIARDILATAFINYFAKFGIEVINYITPNNAFNFEFYLKNLPKLFDVYEMIEEDEGRRVFLAYVLGMSSYNLSDFIFDEMPQYFLHGFFPQSGDILIDGGAFDGSSGSMFKKLGCEVYSFELDSQNFKRAKARGEQEGFIVENFGLGEHRQQIVYSQNLYGSAVGIFNVPEDRQKIGQLISIDEYVCEKNLPRIDFIKLDVEGSELDTLKGGAISIAKWKPRLAISAYHRPEDVYTLAQFLKSIRPDYEFTFRHYPTNYDNEPDLFGKIGKDFLETFNLPLKLPYVYELVLYAH